MQRREDTMRTAGTSDRSIVDRHREHSRSRAVRVGSIVALPSAVIAFFFIWIDTRSGLPEPAATLNVIRFYCIACAVMLFICSAVLSARKRLNYVLFWLFASSFLFVVSARIGFYAGTLYYERMVYAAGLTAFIAFVLIPGGIVQLAPAYIGSLSLMILSHAAAGTLGAHWRDMTDPAVVMAACLFISHLQEKDRFSGFSSALTVERQNEIIKKDAEKIESVSRALMADMVLARQIQYTLIPVRSPEAKGVRIAGMYLPADAIGGDYYDYITFDEKSRIGLFIGDVSGHGIPAALITCMVKTLVSTAGEAKLSPPALLRHVNRALVDQVKGNFLTAFYGIYDTLTGEFTYSRGGHSFPFLIRNGEVTPLKGKGTMLGLDPDADFETRSVQLLPGDRLLLYSDGLIEAADAHGEMFEKKLVSEILPSLGNLPAEVMVNTLFSRLVQFCGSADFEDDISIIGFEVSGGVS